MIYPNYKSLLPGARTNFWHYSPKGKGWYIYGMGTVTPDGKQIVPDAGVSFYAFTRAMFNPAGKTPPGTGPRGSGGGYGGGGGGGWGGDPVDLATSLFVYTKTDLFLPDLIPISLTRTYRQLQPGRTGRSSQIPPRLFDTLYGWANRESRGDLSRLVWSFLLRDG